MSEPNSTSLSTIEASRHPERTRLTDRSLQVASCVRGRARCLGVAYVPAEFSTVEQPRADWVIFSAETDPQVAGGRFAVPSHARTALRQVSRTGVAWDRLLIAHELAPGTLARLASSAPVTPARVAHLLPSSTDDRVAELAGAAAAAFAAVGEAAAVTVGAILAAPVVAGAMVVSMGAGLAGGLAAGGLPSAGFTPLALPSVGLDPAVLGVITASGTGKEGELASVWLLASWT